MGPAMETIVSCANCFRRERWPASAPVEVLQPGGGRQPSQVPQKARGLNALKALEEGRAVVGICSACGQPLVLESGEAEPQTLEIPAPVGTLRITPEGAFLDRQPLDIEGARAWLEEQYPAPPMGGVLEGAVRLPFFAVLLGPLALWVLAVILVVARIVTIAQGIAPEVEGAPGFDGRVQPVKNIPED